MKKFISIFYLFTSTLLALPLTLYGQSKQELKLEAAIIGLEQTTFSSDLLEQKKSIDKDISDFLELKEFFSDKDIVSIEVCYTETQEELGELLNDLGYDFTNWKRQKEIARTPDKFTLKYQDGLEAIMENYQNNCQKKINDLTEAAAIPNFLQILGMVTGVKELFNKFKHSRKDFKKMSEDYFEEKYVNKFRLKPWEEY